MIRSVASDIHTTFNYEQTTIMSTLSHMKIKHQRRGRWVLWPPTKYHWLDERYLYRRNPGMHVLNHVKAMLRATPRAQVAVEAFATDVEGFHKAVANEAVTLFRLSTAYPKATK